MNNKRLCIQFCSNCFLFVFNIHNLFLSTRKIILSATLVCISHGTDKGFKNFNTIKKIKQKKTYGCTCTAFSICLFPLILCRLEGLTYKSFETMFYLKEVDLHSQIMDTCHLISVILWSYKSVFTTSYMCNYYTSISHL